MEINLDGRSVDRVFIQAEIIDFLGLVATNKGIASATVEDIKEWIRAIDSLRDLDDLALHMEITQALIQLQKEDGTISIVGEAHSNTSTVSLNFDGLQQTLPKGKQKH
jgi:hypothetical protein